MTLIDTSAWVEYLRGIDSDIGRAVHRLIETEQPMHTTEVVVMEVLAGGRDEAHTGQLRRLLWRCEFVAAEGLADYEAAAALYRQCRRAGETVRSLNDCVIAAIAIRAGFHVVHADRDFDVLARHTELRLAQ